MNNIYSFQLRATMRNRFIQSPSLFAVNIFLMYFSKVKELARA